jgi:hypothetical protein
MTFRDAETALAGEKAADKSPALRVLLMYAPVGFFSSQVKGIPPLDKYTQTVPFPDRSGWIGLQIGERHAKIQFCEPIVHS